MLVSDPSFLKGNKILSQDWEELGDDIKEAYDSVPSDPRSDGQTLCNLDSIELIGYDKDGEKHTTFV